MCTVPHPAKSIIPVPSSGLALNADSQPAEDHTQCATTGYTSDVSANE